MTSIQRERRRRQIWITSIFAAVVLAPSLYGFAGKFAEFIHIYQGYSDGVFAITPILNYLLASLGFFFLFLWAMFQGMFHDIEQPKLTMLELNDRLDLADSNRNSSKESTISGTTVSTTNPC